MVNVRKGLYLLHVLHENDGVLAGIVQQELLEIGRTCGEHDLVALQHFVFAGQRHVDEVFGRQEFRERVLQVRLITVPPANHQLIIPGVMC